MVECVKIVIIGRSVFQHLYSYSGINWCTKIDVKHKGGKLVPHKDDGFGLIT